ncbi:potassium channel family protein [Aliagarivorans marinus]|uniref:potassium channel family protein n=1 Tax=Aliagarivorans marinus TaxID=561965 RepID=UPI00041450FC|nr:potassium channel family protein [Aliagarivorans marinus]
MRSLNAGDNFYFLFFALLALIFGCAVMQQFYPQGQKTFLGLIIVTLTVAVAGVNRQRKMLRTWYGVLIATMAVSGAFSFFEDYDLSVVTLAALLFFLIAQIVAAVKQVALSDSVTRNHIVGSVCIYMLLGLSWTVCYLLILELLPNAFNGLDALPWLNNLFNAMYFSFITLTTVGYGDISPTLPIAQFFVFMESIVGSFYLAILVASLVSLRLTQAKR